jgi:hypothetical protein
MTPELKKIIDNHVRTCQQKGNLPDSVCDFQFNKGVGLITEHIKSRYEKEKNEAIDYYMGRIFG